ncbi:MAG: helix-turn-helix domain-containing protein [Verrucomicrobia bacterium]|nr:helix-turn-helix domain-containing protein [Verrucomicrobiota bacterium]
MKVTNLAHKILLLKGERTSAALCAGAEISRETFSKIQRGDSTIKLSTLKLIADFLGATKEQWLELVIAWVKEQIGDEAKYLRIEPLNAPMDNVTEDAKKLNELLASFSELERHEIIICLHKLVTSFMGKKSTNGARKKRI